MDRFNFGRRESEGGGNNDGYEFYEDTHDMNGDYPSGLRDLRRDGASDFGRGNETGGRGDEMSGDYSRRGDYSRAYRSGSTAAQQPRSADRPAGMYRNIMVYEPQTADDVQTLIDFLKTRESAIIKLDDIDPETSQRVLDFVSGAIYALNGSVHRIAGNIFLLSPEGVGITNSYENKRK